MAAGATTQTTLRLQSVRTWLWVLIWIMYGYLFLWMFWAITASTYKHEFAQGTGTLDSERWSVDFVFTGALLLAFVIPLSLGYALDSPLREWRRISHVIVVGILFAFYVVVMAFWADYYQHANDATAANARNPANDPRWCNLYYSLPGSGCPQTAPTPGLVPSMLAPSEVFLWKFWFLVVWLFMLVLDFVLVMIVFRSAVRAMAGELAMDESDPLIEPSAPSYDDAYSKPPPAAQQPASRRQQQQSVRITPAPTRASVSAGSTKTSATLGRMPGL